ncbi:hypothetical protein EJ02DRAFT_220808 [Clathrospora elynae]|uniref:Uncharacterized protein n=1 Tax=Clathrospora elynae TaxID=706981 RepID=A0A6A5SQB4_9PLEO|nr:hypothetical protein EJ02DRAFT_220808 [Clathrospora elynae]
MGIPVGWNIKREEAKEQDVLRVDVTGQRSPIRRRTRPATRSRPYSTLDTDFLISAARSGAHVEWIQRPSNTRTRLPPPPVPEVSRADYRSNEASRNPPTLQRDESSLRRSRNRVDRYIRAYETRATVDSERTAPALTPGFAPAAALRTSELDALREARDLSRLRNRSSYRRDADPRLTRSRSPRADRSADRGAGADAPEHGHDSSDNNAVAFPLLRRMGRRNIADGPLPSSSLRDAWSPVPTVDGLGDRTRSVSPFADHMQWDSFLTTVVPDPVAPTAESSFASAAASASFSNSHPSSRAGSSNSATSSQTHITVPSRLPSPPPNEQFMRACDTSEDDTASDTEEEETDVRGSIRRSNARHAIVGYYNMSDATARAAAHATAPRRRIRPSYFSDEPPMRDTERYSPRVMEQSRDASAYVRSFYNSNSWRESEAQTERPQIPQLDGPANEPASISEEEIPPLAPVDLASRDQELRDARLLLERLSRREDISDDFWASVGLTRSFTDPVERFQEREHP